MVISTFLIDILFIIGNFSLFTFLIYRFYLKYDLVSIKKLFLYTLVSKAFFTFVFASLSRYYFTYQTDVEIYIEWAAKTKLYFLNNPDKFYDIYISNSIPEIYYLLDRTYFFIKLLSFLHFVTNDNYWLDHIWFAAFNFACSWFLILKVSKYYPKSFTPLLIVLFFIPLPLVWSCGPLKDSLAFSLLLILLVLFLECIYKKEYIKYMLLSLLPVYLIFQTKFYVIGSLILVFLPYVFIKFLSNKFTLSKLTQLSIYFMTSFFLWIMMELVSHNLYETDIISLIFYNNEMFNVKGNSDYKFYGITVQSWSFVPHIPKAFWEGLFMPLPWQTYSIQMHAEGYFNFCVLVSTALSFYILIREKICFGNLTALLIFYVVLNAVAFGFSSPNWGTLSRYKIYYSPIYYFLLSYILFNSQLGSNTITKLQKFKLF